MTHQKPPCCALSGGCSRHLYARPSPWPRDALLSDRLLGVTAVLVAEPTTFGGVPRSKISLEADRKLVPLARKLVDVSAPTRSYGLPIEVERLLGHVKVDFPSNSRQPSTARVVFATIVSLAGSLGADALLVAIGTTIFASTKHYGHFRLSDYGKLTIIGVVIACAAWPIVTWISSAPRWLFFRLAILVTLFLWLPDLYILYRGQPAKAVAVLMTMHVAIGLVTYNALVHLAPTRRSASRAQTPLYGATTSLEALGSPPQGEPGRDQGCSCFRSVSDGAELQLGGETYREGFQLTTNIMCAGTWTWTWQIGGMYRTFTALVGLDSTNPMAAGLVFLGPDGKPLTFTANGQSVK